MSQTDPQKTETAKTPKSMVKLAQSYYRGLLIFAAAVSCAVSIYLVNGRTSFDGYLYDILVAERARFDPIKPTDPKPVAVIAMDLPSLSAEELAPVPRVYFLAYWGSLLDGIFDAGAKQASFDYIFSWSAAQLYPGLETPFLTALGKYRDRVAIGRTGVVPPLKPFYYAVNGAADPNSVPNLEITPDSDGIQRKVQLKLDSSNGVLPSMVGAIANRLNLTAENDEILLAPRAPLEEQIPTYSMVEVIRCMELDPEAMKRVFGGKVVLFGTTVPDEDRKYSSDYRVTKLDNVVDAPTSSVATGKCNLVPSPRSAPSSTTVPGVHIHALAIEQLINGDIIHIVPTWVLIIIGGIFVALVTAMGLMVSLPRAIIVTVVAEIALFVTATVLIVNRFYLPLSMLMISVAVAMMLAYIARYVFEERKRKRLMKAFGTYLAPEIVSQLAEDESHLKLGGENRELTVFFADLSGFTILSTKVGAEELTATVNRYLTALVDAVDATGGYVDKFIGDAVMAYWGAPVPVEDHATRAVLAAMDAYDRVVKQKELDDAEGRPGFKVKIGLNTGIAVVGNVGTEGRRNYTAIGEAVNVAARLESVPTDYGCNIVVGPGTAEQIATTIFNHELDAIQVKGRAKPVAVYRPLGLVSDMTDVERDFARDYAAALALYRGQKFREAQQAWRELAERSSDFLKGPALAMIERAEGYIHHPPAADWDGVWVKPTK
ncbi:MAG: adenylate/guanylate cyclase domain-containing protein [Candidatus Pacebacteria bacterium]|nr:adenylate/guanylate cyclase domain-containing protein [Candidatus Paceibacterota bacterium]